MLLSLVVAIHTKEPVLTDVKRPDASELWDSMRTSHSPFALLDPTTHHFVDCNAPYAEVYDLSMAEVTRASVTSLYPPEFAESIAGLFASFARGTLHVIRGQMTLPRSNGKTIEVEG